MLKIVSPFSITEDQQRASDALARAIASGESRQTLLGVTGSGKTFTMASVIEKTQKPALIISPNKTLAAQLYQEFRDFFPDASVHYFVSYYDYYQPEAYIPQSDTYIEKDMKINQQLDRLRHEATQAILERNDVIVVASVSCIYNIGSPASYDSLSLDVHIGKRISRSELLRHLISLQYEKNNYEIKPGIFKVKGEVVEIFSAGGDRVIKIELPQNSIENITLCEMKHFAAQKTEIKKINKVRIFPAKYWISPENTLPLSIENIKSEMEQRLAFFKKEKKFIEEQRLRERTLNDIEMLEQNGYCHGVENYSRHMEFRAAGDPPYTLLDYMDFAYKKDFVVFLDESHVGIPQIKAMAEGDRARKKNLIAYGFRLPSAMDNRPLTFAEFNRKVPRAIFVSATPAPYERSASQSVVEQLIRPTGLLDPSVEVRPTKNQIANLAKELMLRIKKKQRALVTTITKRMAEDIAEYLSERRIKASYLHSEIKTLERPDILKKLREGTYDVLVGINLLREGLDIPEVSLVAILDADKEGFLRNETTLIQTMGRAARHPEGHIIMYADTITGSMRNAIGETDRRRKLQDEYNKKRGMVPSQIIKPIKRDVTGKQTGQSFAEQEIPLNLLLTIEDPKKLITTLEKEMNSAAEKMEFEQAAYFRDKIKEIKRKIKK